MRRCYYNFAVIAALSISLLAGCGSQQMDSASESTTNAVETETESETETTVAEITDGNYPIDENYMTIHGRYLAWNGTVWLSYSASGIEFNYTDCTECTISLTGDSTAGVDASADHQTRYAVYVNDALYTSELMDETSKEVTVSLADYGTEGTINFVKLSESSDSSIGITGVQVDGSISPMPEKDLAIEFIGDSITCGYGADGELGDTYSTSNENAMKSYAYKTAMELDADYHMVSFSGYGIISGYTGDGEKNTVSLMPTYYDKQGNSYGTILTGIKNGTLTWDFTRWQPDLVVINLGTNDASYAKTDEQKEEFRDGYIAFLKTVREYNPNAKIVCTLGLMGDTLYPQVEEAVSMYSEETGDQEVSSFRLSVQDPANGYGVDYHPTEVNHYLAADELSTYLKELLGK